MLKAILPVTVDDEVILRLENGKTTIYKRFMINASIIYNKTVTLKAMSGPKTIIKKSEPEGMGFRNVIVAFNPSLLEIDLGIVKHEIRNSRGEKIAEQKGRVHLKREESTYVMTGSVMGEATGEEATVVGIGTEQEDSWPHQAIQSFNVPLKLTNEFLTLCSVKGTA